METQDFDLDDIVAPIFGRLNKDGNVDLFHATGEVVTQLDPDECAFWPVWPVDSDLSAGYDHPTGIVLTLADALRLGIPIEK